MLDHFLGVWVLDASKNDYVAPTAPVAGTYTISCLEGEHLLFQMQWADKDQQTHQAQYSSCIDGKQYPYENPQLAEFISSSLVLPDVMETLTFKDGKINSRGIRKLSKDLTTLYVEQIMYLPDGQELVNKSEYRRKL